MCEELRGLQAQADSQLREERSRRCSLLQEAQGAAFNTQKLLLKLQQAEEEVRVRPWPGSSSSQSRPSER